MKQVRMHNTTPGGAIFEWCHIDHKTIMYDCKGGFHKIPTAHGRRCVLCERVVKR